MYSQDLTYHSEKVSNSAIINSLNICIIKLDDSQADSCPRRTWKCPTCAHEVVHVADFSAPMNLPGEKVLKADVQVTVLKPHDGLLECQSVYTMRL